MLNGGTIKDAAGNNAVLTLAAPGAAGSLGAAKDIVIDTPPILAQISPVPSLSNNPTPSYTFSSSEAGTITYGGACSSVTTSAVVGNNTVTFAALADGTYANCTITVTDAAGLASIALAVNSFTVDLTAPVITAPTTNSAASNNKPTWTWSITEAHGLAPTPYSLQWSQDATFATGVFGGTSASASFTHVNALADGTWYFRVRATDAVGNVGQYSPAGSDTIVTAASSGKWPTSLSANHRYLLDQNGQPWMMVGDSPQCLSAQLSEADMEYFFADRQAHGFNTAWVNLMCGDYTGGRVDHSTYDGILPYFNGDISQPNEAYFARMDHMVQMAENHGITLLLDPAETGSFRFALFNAGTADSHDFGVFLGNRYKSFPNIIWMVGNDYYDGLWSQFDPVEQAMMQGIREGEKGGVNGTDPTHLQTGEFINADTSGSSGPHDMYDDPSWLPLLDLATAYTYSPTYNEVLHEYNQPNPKPTFMVEAHYEFEGRC